MLLLDRYFAGRAGAIAVQILLLVILLLTVENLTRLLDLVGDVESPMVVLVRMMTALIPEYVAIGTFFAVYLGIGLTVRSMCLQGEWSIIAASGQSPRRRAVMPLALGLIGALLLLGIRLELQPRGEETLDDLGNAAATGRLGIAFDVGDFVALPGGGTITIDRYDRASQTVRGVFVTSRDLTATAPYATMSHFRGRQIKLVLHDGTSLRGDRPAVAFSQMQLLIDRESSLLHPNRGYDHPDQLDRLHLSRLWQRVAIEQSSNDGPYPATSSLAARIANGLFCVLIPLLALATAELPPRKTTGFALGMGMIAIVGFIKGLAWTESAASTWPVTGITVYMVLWTAVIGAIYWASIRSPGHIELTFSRLFESPLAWLLQRVTGCGQSIPPSRVVLQSFSHPDVGWHNQPKTVEIRADELGATRFPSGVSGSDRIDHSLSS